MESIAGPECVLYVVFTVYFPELIETQGKAVLAVDSLDDSNCSRGGRVRCEPKRDTAAQSRVIWEPQVFYYCVRSVRGGENEVFLINHCLHSVIVVVVRYSLSSTRRVMRVGIQGVRIVR